MRRRARLIAGATSGRRVRPVAKMRCPPQRGRLAAIGASTASIPRRPGRLGSRSARSAPQPERPCAGSRPTWWIVYGTRIIKCHAQGSVAAPFINYHAGINPKYRGQNGAYWARSQGERHPRRGTVHSIDEGIDTGGRSLPGGGRLRAQRQHRPLPAPTNGRGPAPHAPRGGGCPQGECRRGALTCRPASVPPDAVGLLRTRRAHQAWRGLTRLWPGSGAARHHELGQNASVLTTPAVPGPSSGSPTAWGGTTGGRAA